MVVLLTDKLDKSEVEYQGSYDDVVEVAVLFDVRSGRSFCFGVVCTEVIEDLSLFRRCLRRMCIPFAVSVALSTFTSQNFRFKGDLVAGLGHVAFFFSVFASASCDSGLLAELFFIRSCRVASGRPWRQARRNSVPSNARQTQHGQVGVRGGCTRDGGTKAAVGKQVHHTAQASAQADTHTHTHVHVAMWCSFFFWKRMSVERGVWDDTSRTAMHAHQEAHHTNTGWC